MARKRAYFIAGTDTGVGKTQVAAGLLQVVRERELSSLGVKPIAAGCERTSEGLRNEDAVLLQSQSSLPMRYEQINPVALEPAIAPHIAAEEAGRRLSVDQLNNLCREVMGQADVTLVEGAGGWRVPLNPMETLADLAISLELPVILVVGLRLGCLNHALLTAEAIESDGLKLAGWVANSVEPDMPRLEENFSTLEQRLSAPCLGRIPHLPQPTPSAIAPHLTLPHGEAQ